jgi:hypothetical protein
VRADRGRGGRAGALAVVQVLAEDARPGGLAEAGPHQVVAKKPPERVLSRRTWQQTSTVIR